MCPKVESEVSKSKFNLKYELKYIKSLKILSVLLLYKVKLIYTYLNYS